MPGSPITPGRPATRANAPRSDLDRPRLSAECRGRSFQLRPRSLHSAPKPSAAEHRAADIERLLAAVRRAHFDILAVDSSFLHEIEIKNLLTVDSLDGIM
jgi:hypothetical protein